jgi:protein TonB
MLVAVILSLALHGVLLLCRLGWPPLASQSDVPLRVITVQLPDTPPPPPVQTAAAPMSQITPTKKTMALPQQAVTAVITRPAEPEEPVADMTPDRGDALTPPQVASLPGQATAPPHDNILAETETSPEAAPQLAHPMYLENQPPDYPPLARKQRYQGTTELVVLVTKDGTAHDLRLQNSSGHPVLDQAALAAVRHWKFVPGRQGVDPIAMWVTVPVRFELQ